MEETTDQRSLRWLLAAIVVFLALIAVELSVLTGSVMPYASAQVPDEGLQRLELLEAQRLTNTRLEQILRHLQTQTIKVEVTGTDKDPKRPAPKATTTAPRVYRPK